MVILGIAVFHVLSEVNHVGSYNPACFDCTLPTVTRGWPLTEYSSVKTGAVAGEVPVKRSTANAIANRAIGGVVGAAMGGLLLLVIARAGTKASRPPDSVDHVEA